MAFSISDITSAMGGGGGLARPNMFFVRITPPSKLISSTYPRDALFFCDAAVLPGLNYSSQPIRAVGYGTTEQRPVSADFSEFNTTFIVDAKGRAFKFFQQWMAMVNNWSIDPIGQMEGSDLEYGEWNYPVTYEGTVEIHALNPLGSETSSGSEGFSLTSSLRGSTPEEVISYQLVHAFPKQIGDVSVAWEQNDSVMRLPISFAYNSWTTKNVPPVKQVDPPYGQGLSLLTNKVTPAQASYFANSQ